MLLHSDTLSLFRANPSLFLFLNTTFLVEKQHILILVFSFTWQGLELMIYSTRGEHGNQYTTDIT
jgi:hypothetical protein